MEGRGVAARVRGEGVAIKGQQEGSLWGQMLCTLAVNVNILSGILCYGFRRRYC